MKKLAKEEKQGKLDSSASKNNPIKSNGNLNSDLVQNSQQTTEENKPEERKNRKKPTKEIELRRKLHDLERSPPPKLNIKNVKSKIGSLSGVSVKKKNNNNNNMLKQNSPRNTMNKRNMKSKGKKNNTKDSSDKNNINIKSIKKTTGFNEESLLKQINNIQREVNQLSNNFNLNVYFQKKDKEMQKFKKIPFIKPDCSYIKTYSNNVYGKIIAQINKQYDEIKN